MKRMYINALMRSRKYLRNHSTVKQKVIHRELQKEIHWVPIVTSNITAANEEVETSQFSLFSFIFFILLSLLKIINVYDLQSCKILCKCRASFGFILLVGSVATLLSCILEPEIHLLRLFEVFGKYSANGY